MPIRAYRSEDLPILFSANEASVPGVGAATQPELEKWISLSTCLVATDEADAPLGFITLIAPGEMAYDSANLRWFEDYVQRTGKRLIYVDRIAILPDARGNRLGEALYTAAFAHFSDLDEIGCEVNIEPPNPGSHRFHIRLGFHQIAERSHSGGSKSVAFYVRALA